MKQKKTELYGPLSHFPQSVHKEDGGDDDDGDGDDKDDDMMTFLPRESRIGVAATAR